MVLFIRLRKGVPLSTARNPYLHSFLLVYFILRPAFVIVV